MDCGGEGWAWRAAWIASARGGLACGFGLWGRGLAWRAAVDCVGDGWVWRKAVDCVDEVGLGARLWIVSARLGLV